jgi:hypothetical protein
MKKDKFTESKAENNPTGGVLVGKRQGQTIIHDKGTLSGYLVGKTHAEGGIKAINKSTGQPLEMQGGEVVITAPAVSDQTKHNFDGEMLTNRQILSKINEKGGGVAFAQDGMEIPKYIKRTGATYNFGGKTMTDHEIYKYITGGYVSYKDKYNRKYKYKKNTSHSLEEIAKDTGVSLKGIQQIYNKGIGAYKTNPSSVRPNVKSKEQWAMARVYSSVMGGKASKVDANELKMNTGGKVNLVSQSKKGDHNSRDLNNYNDLLDVGADGQVGADNGLGLAKGGSLDFLNDVEQIFARGGATDIIVNNWNDIPDDFKSVTLPKEIEWLPNPTNKGLYEIVKPFLGTEDLRPAMQGINFDDIGITTTNAHILLNIPEADSGFEGIYKPVKLPKSDSISSTKIDVKYPNYKQVLPTEKDITKVFDYINIEKLLIYCKVAKNYSGNQEIVFKINNEQMQFFPDYIIDVITSWIKLTGLSYAFINFQTKRKALVFSGLPTFTLGKNTIALIMPNIFGSAYKLGARNTKKKAELNVYFDFDDNEIHNSDGSIVADWSEKPKKTRKPRAKKVVETKPFDLTNTKIWIGDNPELSRAVQEKAFQLGWRWSSGKTPKYLEGKSLFFYDDKSMAYSDNNKPNFDNDSKREIFASDLMSEATTTDIEVIDVFSLTGLTLEGKKFIFGGSELVRDLIQLENTFPERETFPYRIYDFKDKEYGSITFGKGIKNLTDLTIAIIDKPDYKEYNWNEFLEYEREVPKTTSVEPKPISEKVNFELERKFLTSRINDLSLELNVKKLILSREEISFYQREINKFIQLLRNVNEKEQSSKLISERFDAIYSVKFGDYKKEYPTTDLKSINGLTTELTEQEYLDVRTPEFKAFFGDWQNAYLTNNYDSVSKVINEKTKEPIPVYHGTNVLFTNWKTYETNNAHYFAVRRDFSDFFATTWEQRTDKSALDSKTIKSLNPNKGTFMFRCFIDVKNPIDFSKFGVDKYPVSDFLTFLKINYNIADYDFWTSISFKDKVDKDTMVYAWQIIRLWQSFTQYVKLFTMHDGYIFYEFLPDSPKLSMDDASLCYCAFDSNQIKFNDAYEFNALSNDSRFDFGGKL